MSSLVKQKFLQILIMTFSLVCISLLGIGVYYFLGKPTPTKTDVLTQYFKFPLRFESNQGQTEESVKYLTKGQGYTFYFTPKEMVMVLQKALKDKTAPSTSTIKIQFVDANANPIVRGTEELQGKSNYFVGNDSNKWRTNIPNYTKVFYQDLYPGVDVAFYGNQEQLEYDILVSPGRNPQDAHLHIEGIKELLVDNRGNLRLLVDDNQEVQMQKPFVYQMVDGKKVSIEGQFVLLAHNEVGFAVGAYDPSKLLVIDPILSYSTYLGGSLNDEAFGIAIDREGNAYVTGLTQSIDFPTTPNALQSNRAGSQDAFVTKINPSGTDLIYSTYLGGNGSTQGHGIDVDKHGNAYITGVTNSINFPITANALQPTLAGGNDGFVTKLNATGSALVYSTYLGGTANEEGRGITIDKNGYAYVTGETSSSDFPITANAFQTNLAGQQNGFVAKLNPTGSALVYSTYLGGDNTELPHSIAVDKRDNAYVTGTTSSSNFPTTKQAFQTTLEGPNNAYITKLNPKGSALIYSTFLGGSVYEEAFGIALDRNDNAYVTGYTCSSDFPITEGAFQTTLAGKCNAFVTKLNRTGSNLVYSTYLGGNNVNLDLGHSIAVDKNGAAYVTGLTTSSNFPVTEGAIQTTLAGTQNAFYTKFNRDGSDLVYSTYLGGNNTDIARGIAINNKNGAAYITGATNSTNFPTTAGAFQTTLAGSNDVFITKIVIPLALPPIHLKGFQIANQFATQTDYVNILTWDAPLGGPPPVTYEIYRDRNLTQLVASVSADEKLRFEEHNRKKGKTYTYYILSVNEFGNFSSTVASVTIEGQN